MTAYGPDPKMSTDADTPREAAVDDVIRSLAEWADQMGGWDDPVWDRVLKLLQPPSEPEVVDLLP